MDCQLRSFILASSDTKLIDQVKLDIDGMNIELKWSGNYIDSISYLEENADIDLLLLDLDSTILSGNSAIKMWKNAQNSIKKQKRVLPQLLLLSNASNLEECFVTRSYTNTEILIKPFHIDHLKAYYQKIICHENVAVETIKNTDTKVLSVPETSETVSELQKELSVETSRNIELTQKREEIIWKYLRLFKFPNIPNIKQCKEDENQVGNYVLTDTLSTKSNFCKRIGVNTEDNKYNCIKIINKSKLINIEDIEKVDLEISILQNLHHDNIIRLVNVEHTPGYILVVEEYASGGSLRDRITKSYPISEDDIGKVLSQLLSAVEYIHARRICHRLISPENILFDEFGNLKLIGFRSSIKQLPGSFLSDSCENNGYISPEILSGKPYDGLLSDIFSVGCILIYILLGSDELLCDISNLHDSDSINEKIMDIFNHDKLANISSNLIDFLRHTFVLDESQRSNSVALLRHPLLARKQLSLLTFNKPKSKFKHSSSQSGLFKKEKVNTPSKSTPIATPRHSNQNATPLSPRHLDNPLSPKPITKILSPKLTPALLSPKNTTNLSKSTINEKSVSDAPIFPLLNVTKYNIAH